MEASQDSRSLARVPSEALIGPPLPQRSPLLTFVVTTDLPFLQSFTIEAHIAQY